MRELLKKYIISLAKEIWKEMKNKNKKTYKNILLEIPEDFEDNGCSFAPDWLPACGCIKDVCRAHDWEYAKGGTKADRKEADSRLRRGIISKAAGKSWLTRVRANIDAFIYWRAVRRVGFMFFNYTDGTKLDATRTLKTCQAIDIKPQLANLKKRLDREIEKS